ncbi:MAG TPA: deoxyribose-phosphate aldolase [Methanothermobacter sp.]|jgi:deoxyribose-phosphate aldolase|uniref:Deoxyribose-phosphate aldolase n=1 Tax=Methanothermobacter tenebrarum TaxID=680118 RepID=A0ABM7YCI6_9EURY|nr:deoxyribose-phosphate aldolase [Methanothermobacter tenebrarum]MDD3454787.1 deoxyribose-phosphate aldolase [Methanobacteriales archaeon]MDX9693660.1 deoxyribose-phosphate aldolase [Methanothermobacter sp.]BDH79186.1 2-deoxyribose-5-phosphate aldolase [Methanothermobacter tenebrarum]HHW17192.1 deoxyribose-phosphate aldolase [Methanothermobacter sp.]
MEKESFAHLIDHTNVKADATADDIIRLCKEAVHYGFGCVMVTPINVKLASQMLKGTPVRVGSVIGFPTGTPTPRVKAFEAKEAIKDGASELDMVINIGALKSRELDLVADDIKGVVEVAEGNIVKVIIEIAYLTEKEKILACKISKKAGADYVKTSTAYCNLKGATLEDVKLLRSVVGKNMGVKASGGIMDLKTALAMIEAGADRIGTSSGVQIIREWENLMSTTPL